MIAPCLLRCAPLWLLVCLSLCGCDALFYRGSDRENPLINDGIARRKAHNFRGAADLFEKALESNPRLAVAHWELGSLYWADLDDYAAAIYHFEKLLKINPKWRQANTARQLIDECKKELAKEAPLGPWTPREQRRLDNLTARIHDLERQNGELSLQMQAWKSRGDQLQKEKLDLEEELKQMRATPVRFAVLSSPPSAPRPKDSSQPIGTSGNRRGSTRNVAPRKSPANPGRRSPASSPSRTRIVRKGENLTGIASQYNVSIEAILVANPAITDPDRIKEGQRITIPSR